MFTVQGSLRVCQIRNTRGTKWASFQEDLRDRLGRHPEMNTKVEAGLGLILWVQQALILAYEDNCPLRPVKTGRYSLKCTSELDSLRKGVR